MGHRFRACPAGSDTGEFCYGRGRQDWHEESVILRDSQPETDYLNIYLLLQDAVGKVWFDDVTLTPLSLAETERTRRVARRMVRGR